jgi:hypothetical protein
MQTATRSLCFFLYLVKMLIVNFFSITKTVLKVKLITIGKIIEADCFIMFKKKIKTIKMKKGKASEIDYNKQNIDHNKQFLYLQLVQMDETP